MFLYIKIYLIKMFESIQKYCQELTREFEMIPMERKLLLDKIVSYIQSKRAVGQPVHLVYICTHNSRRSHFGQVWAHVAASFFGIKNVFTFSGGTEATAFNQNAIDAFIRIGFDMKKITEGLNPTYAVVFDESFLPAICFSKEYDHPQNPKTSFAAIMTCSDAEENCPFIPGVELRIGTTYEDPKAFDNTPFQNEKYDERCRQIARETFYVFSRV